MIQTLSHLQAQMFIQASADESLAPNEKSALDAHLLECAECRSFAQEFARVESALRQTMQNRWNLSARPLPIGVILGWQNRAPILRALSMAAAPLLVVILALVFLLTNGSFSNGNELTATVIATNIPTPSAQLMRTNTSVNECETVHYIVQKGDTLEDIAAKYSISKEEIVSFNNLERETLTPSIDLAIPLCQRQTTSTPSTTMTFTPSISAVSSTP